MNSTTFTILLGGSLTVTDRLRDLIDGSRFIAADSGIRHASTLGVTPELWVGDFDSSDALLKARWASVKRHSYPAAKAATDGEIAVAEALARGADRLILAGAMGGERSDHALQHMLHALALAAEGIEIMLTSGEEEAYPLIDGDEMELELPRGSLFSVLGFTNLAGLTLGNVRYPLTGFSLPFGSSRTISNIAEGAISVSLATGRALLMARPYDLTGA
ncbi:thiamine diphosphokinase [Rhizobium oryzicola]|uniref:Thiamine diphosphokinase n=1 Tax=Rhizobium oryzicola TaxID=1232668 RepID=A0ABT8T3C7_9HYPH|nr:thiamine diphosphokinase [Rhizobium oryzicola]MDO1585191.1 thiamine diphosphokinase [Rhizobium oryzicola]